MGKQQYRSTNCVQKAAGLNFEVVKREQIEQQSHLQVISDRLFRGDDQQRMPEFYSVLDRRLGTSSKDNNCETCGQDVLHCPGHWGFIDLEVPLFHVGYFGQVINILQTICKECSHVMLPKAVKQKYINIMNSKLSYVNKKKIRKEILAQAKKSVECTNCSALNGLVKKGVGLLKIVHDMLRKCSKKKKDELLQERIEELTRMLDDRGEAEKLAAASFVHSFTPREVYQLLKRIPERDIPLLGMPLDSVQRPQDLIMTSIPVPPIVIRPSVKNDVKVGSSTEDDITMCLKDIAFFHSNMKNHQFNNANPYMYLTEDLDFLQAAAARLINGEAKYPSEKMLPTKPKRCYMQRLKGKEGRFRGNLSGKRVDFSGRTVISPNPNLKIDQVGVPIHIAMTLTYPERVNSHNITYLQKLVAAGAHKHPGANYYDRPGQSRKDLGYGDTKAVSLKLRAGDIVERHLKDGDIVLFNRQPSLHKLSIMAHRVKVQNTRTFSFNECVCGPYNADFDGDEMNLHVPQTEEARTEALILMGTKSNLVTPRSGELMIGATQDFLTGAYLITQKDHFMTRDKFCQLINSILVDEDAAMRIDLPKPAIVKPIELWSGKQLFSLIMRPNKKCPVKCNLRAKTKPYKGSKEEMTADDSFVVIRNSELLAGALDKSVLGSGGKSNIFYILLRDFGENVSSKAMARLARLASYFLMNRGFSIGIEDVMPDEKLNASKKELIKEKYKVCDELIVQHKNNALECMPGCSMDTTLETRLLGTLSEIRELAGRTCLESLPRHNSPMTMALCGSKGSTINICQMIACVGQQAISGKRVPDGFSNRALPHFPVYSREPDAKGFVANSFYTGLTPTEFFFHTMAGREGLVDTAVKTAETGYMQRRLMKGLEDLCVQYDNTVRNCNNVVVQFCYGEDGLDPTFMEGKDQPVDFERVLEHVKAKSPYRTEEGLEGNKIIHFTEQMLRTEMDKCGSSAENFKRLIREFMVKVATRVENIRSLQGVNQGRHPLKVELELERLTLSQLVEFFETCREKFVQARIEPGTAVGALAGQSIGEPGTQMTLKTFHFAGVASMNITLGVPRILEIMNASKTTSTPLIMAKLDDECQFEEGKARRIKGRVERTTLGEVCRYLEEVVLPDEFFIIVRIDIDRIKLLQLELNAVMIAYMIDISSKPKIKANVEVKSASVLKVVPLMMKEKRDPQEVLQELAILLPQVTICGISTVSRAVISHDDKDKQKLQLVIEGSGLRDVLATRGIDWKHTRCNNINEVKSVLGIEAARATIIEEIRFTMRDYGITLDVRHLMLLADLMTSVGEMHGMTRFGLEKMKESVLMLASFERTSDHLFEAAHYGQRDSLSGVSESIIIGNPMAMGTGLCKLLYKSPEKEEPWNVKTPLLATLLEEHGNRSV
ncbi:Hypothetical predicted protein [Cloeon dipterum]|uniref:DNA-directed RNA polymerase subunit n=1 Tax=Cloeon dipterum TaxID=197152 RepID=A0A8S1BY95_9INSE|nr:Hypothetical predicted protein [Cloeon dipterum]